ncbi:MAG TPA: hypothetical protein VGC82_05195, partial [Rhodopila sp.]
MPTSRRDSAALGQWSANARRTRMPFLDAKGDLQQTQPDDGEFPADLRGEPDAIKECWVPTDCHESAGWVFETRVRRSPTPRTGGKGPATTTWGNLAP